MGVFSFPFAAPSTGAFGGKNPKGRGMNSARRQRVMDDPSAASRRKRGVQDQSGNQVAFSLVTFFWRRTNLPGANLNSQRLARKGQNQGWFS
jgi:hypothetical protein